MRGIRNTQFLYFGRVYFKKYPLEELKVQLATNYIIFEWHRKYILTLAMPSKNILNKII